MNKYNLIINDLNIEVHYNKSDIDKYFLPMLKSFKIKQKELNKRLIIFLAAAPGSGKSTFVSFLECLSVQNNINLQSLGIDGFHYYQDYLNKHYLEGTDILLSDIKGNPNTFDVIKLKEKIIELKNNNIYWPLYSRNLHDPLEDKIYVDKDIIIIEGNYLLYNKGPWKDIKNLCDISIFMHVDESILKERLIKRKGLGGSSHQEALTHFENVDKKNIELIINNSYIPDIKIGFDKNNKVVSYKDFNQLSHISTQ